MLCKSYTGFYFILNLRIFLNIATSFVEKVRGNAVLFYNLDKITELFEIKEVNADFLVRRNHIRKNFKISFKKL